MAEGATATAASDIPFYPMERDARCPFDPSPQLRALQNQRMTRVRIWDGSTPWLVTGYDDQRALLSDQRLSIVATNPGYPASTPGLLARRSKQSTFISHDDPDHARVRRMLTGLFAIKRMEALRPGVQRVVDNLLDDMVAGPRPVDFVKAFALPVPSLVICEMLGVPYDAHPFFQKNSAIIVSATADPKDVVEAQQQLIDYVDQLLVERLRSPSDDVLSELAIKRVKTGDLTQSEAALIGSSMLFAGHETTANMTTLGTLLLLVNPDQLRQIRDNSDDADLIASATEELLRYLSIVQNGRRRAALEDITIGDQTIHAGEGVILCSELANREESVYPEPDRFDIYRNPRNHVAFGYGIHQCLGQPLARLELQVVLSTLFRRLPDLALAVPFEDLKFKAQSSVVYGVETLPITF